MHLASFIKARDIILALLPELNRVFNGDVEHDAFQFPLFSPTTFVGVCLIIYRIFEKVNFLIVLVVL